MKEKLTQLTTSVSLTQVGMAMMLLLIPAVRSTAQVNAIPQNLTEETQKRRITGQVLDDQG